MPELIVHHYPMSPFCEKLRLGLGYKQLPWRSVLMPAISPKPDLVALTGGYRRAPVLQVGADIYCDTALMFDVLEHAQPLPSFYPEPSKGMARILAQWADSTLFWAAMGHSFGAKGASQVFAGMAPEAAKAFADDRSAMRGTMTRLRPGDALSAYRSYLRRLSDMLDDGPYLLGELPCVADFAVYHALWFTRERAPTTADVLQATPAVIDWMDRMREIGHGTSERMTPQEAIDVARAATPLPLSEGEPFQDDHGIGLGSEVTIAAESFGTEPTEGELVAATRMHYTLRRTDPRAGTVHVHFPRIGYVLKKKEASA